MQLQRAIDDTTLAETAVAAISYDSVGVLRRFVTAHGITYALLGDVGSRVITALGLLNTTIEQERRAYGRSMDERHWGLPYPGTFMLDENGVVTGRHFERIHRIRPTPQTLLASTRPAPPGEAAGPAAEQAGSEVAVIAWLDAPVVAANQLQALRLRLSARSGVHLYTEPVPDGLKPLAVALGGNAALRVREPVLPAGRPFTVTGLDDRFFVVEGRIDVTCEFFVEASADTSDDPPRQVTLTVDVRYQACTEIECFPPKRVRLELPLTVEPTPP